MEPAEHIEIEMLEIDDFPESACFIFHPVDGGTLTAQVMLDAFADFLLHQNPDALRLSPPKDTN